MSVEAPILYWPIVWSAAPVLRVTTGATTEDLTLAATVGRYYWQVGGAADTDGGVGGVGDAIVALQTALNTNTGGGTYTVTRSASGYVTIACSAPGPTPVNFRLLLGHANTTLDPTLYGFTATSYPLGGASYTVTSPYVAKGIWQPGQPPTVDSRDRQPIVGGVATAISGLARTARLATPRKTRSVRWEHLLQSLALDEYAASADPYGTAETMWREGLSYGRPVRYYELPTSAPTTHTLYRTRSVRDPITRDEAYRVRWSVALDLQRVTA